MLIPWIIVLLRYFGEQLRRLRENGECLYGLVISNRTFHSDATLMRTLSAEALSSQQGHSYRKGRTGTVRQQSKKHLIPAKITLYVAN